MRRPVAILLAVLIVAVAWLFLKHFEIRGFEQVRVLPKPQQVETMSAWGNTAWDGLPWRFGTTRTTSTAPGGIIPKTQTRQSIRIASFNIGSFGPTKASKPEVMDVLARILRKFDIVAMQELRSDRPDVLPDLVDLVNGAGRHYDFVVGPRLGRDNHKEQYAFVFDRATIHLDRDELYTVEDPWDRMHREPLVGWFCVRGPDKESAFTFSLVNIHVDPNDAGDELDLLDDVFYAIRRDGRNEDDVILAGDFNAASRKLGQLGSISGLITAIADIPTNTRATAQYNNIIFQLPATEEFNGRAGVFDFMREYNLTLNSALEVSDHLPVWAEFSIHEGGNQKKVAASGRGKGPAFALRQ